MIHLAAASDGNPTLRADVFVSRWQGLERQRIALLRGHEDSKMRAVEKTMIGMAKSLERDPQVESILRIRKGELELPRIAVRRYRYRDAP